MLQYLRIWYASSRGTAVSSIGWTGGFKHTLQAFYTVALAACHVQIHVFYSSRGWVLQHGGKCKCKQFWKRGLCIDNTHSCELTATVFTIFKSGAQGEYTRRTLRTLNPEKLDRLRFV